MDVTWPTGPVPGRTMPTAFSCVSYAVRPDVMEYRALPPLRFDTGRRLFNISAAPARRSRPAAAAFTHPRAFDPAPEGEPA
jgi:hypothetical protein